MKDANGGVRRRALFSRIALVATPPAGTTPDAATVPASQDARLLQYAADLHAAEAMSAKAIRRHARAERRGDSVAIAAACIDMDEASERVDAALNAMAATPAEGLLGLTIKACRLCTSLIDNAGDLIVSEEDLVSSLLADCVRLAPIADIDAVGGGDE